MKIAAFVTAIIIFSQLGNIIRISEAHPIATTFRRLLLATGILLPFAIYMKGYKELFNLRIKHIRSLLLSSVYLTLTFTIFIYSVMETTVANAMLLFSIHPIITALLSYYILKDKIVNLSLHSYFLYC